MDMLGPCLEAERERIQRLEYFTKAISLVYSRIAARSSLPGAVCVVYRLGASLCEAFSYRKSGALNEDDSSQATDVGRTANSAKNSTKGRPAGSSFCSYQPDTYFVPTCRRIVARIVASPA